MAKEVRIIIKTEIFISNFKDLSFFCRIFSGDSVDRSNKVRVVGDTYFIIIEDNTARSRSTGLLIEWKMVNLDLDVLTAILLLLDQVESLWSSWLTLWLEKGGVNQMLVQ